jgi:hypothetical protein
MVMVIARLLSWAKIIGCGLAGPALTANRGGVGSRPLSFAQL